MKTSFQALAAAHQSCVDEALKQLPFVMERWCSKLLIVLYERSMAVVDAAERLKIQNAIAVLRKTRPLIEHGFTDQLVNAIARDSLSSVPSVNRGPAGLEHLFSAPSFNALEVMRDDQVQEAVESARLLQVIKLACKQGFDNFSAHLGTGQGFQAGKARSNPLRPEIIAQALLRLLQSLPVNSQTRGYWLSDGAQVMGVEMQQLYGLLSDLLAVHVNVSAPAAARAPAVPETRLAEKDEPANIERKPMLTLGSLHHLLAGDQDSALKGVPLLPGYAAGKGVQHNFSHTVPEALDVLVELEAKGLGRATAGVGRLVPSEPVMQLRTHLKKTAKSPGQSLAIEVVGVMIEQIANDSKLLLPVRQVVANAEPAFLRLAVTDPRFFSNKSHPARRLLEALTSSSLAYASERAAGFPGFMHNLQQVAALLTEEHAGDTQHFTTLLEDFERRHNRHSPENRQSQQRAEQALLQAELRNLVAVKIAAEMKLRPDFVADNRIISSFLTGPWAHVMASERLLGENATPGWQKNAFSLTLGDVLWSVDIARTSSHRKRLLEIIPGMLSSLHQGLRLIDYPPEQSQPFFDELMACHQPALTAHAAALAPSAQTGHKLEKMFVADDDDSFSMQPWLAPAEAHDSGFMQNPHDDSAAPGHSLGPPQSQGSSSADQTGQPATVQSVDLQLGAWIELLVDTRWVRAQLTWASPRNTLFMFTSEAGRKHSMTLRILQNLLDKRLVRVISQQGVIDSALDNVAQTAMRNSVASG